MDFEIFICHLISFYFFLLVGFFKIVFTQYTRYLNEHDH